MVYFKTTFRNVIYDAMRKRGWKETEDEKNWDFSWVEKDWMAETFDTLHLEPHQRVNHYRNSRELCRKDLLIKNLKRQKRQLQREGSADEAAAYDFWPMTYMLPGDYALFAEEFKRTGGSGGGAWIMKPIGRSQGKGIFIFKTLSAISKWRTDGKFKNKSGGGGADGDDGKEGRKEASEAEAYVVQRYIANPYLIGGRKFDLRLYVLVTSYMPLTVWMYRGGFCRFSTQRYNSSLNAKDLENSFVHLTNVAIQKKSDTYSEETGGGKWEIRSLKLHLMSRYGAAAVDALFRDIHMLILRSLYSVQQVMIHDKHCFELYGYDVLFDDTFKPWLLEVNASPSLTANTKDDYHLKLAMLTSVLDIVDVEGNLSGDEMRVGGFDLIYKNNSMVGSINNPASNYSTMLGCDIPAEPTVRCASGARKPSTKRDGASKDDASGAASAAGGGGKSERSGKGGGASGGSGGASEPRNSSRGKSERERDERGRGDASSGSEPTTARQAASGGGAVDGPPPPPKHASGGSGSGRRRSLTTKDAAGPASAAASAGAAGGGGGAGNGSTRSTTASPGERRGSGMPAARGGSRADSPSQQLSRKSH